METKLLSGVGVLESNDKFILIKKVGKKDELIPKHNHEKEIILFQVLKGKILVTLNDSEDYIVECREVLKFDGINYISAIFLEDSEINIVLIKK